MASDQGAALADEGRPARSGRWLNRIEQLGNALPDPVLIFLVLIAVLMLVSAIGEASGWTAANPVSGEVLVVKSLFGEDMVRRLLQELPKTFAAFPPLGIALLLVMGAGVADHSGLLSVAVRSSLQRLPLLLLTPAVFLTGMMTTHAQDAGYVVYVPLAGLLYAGVGRHPVLGIVTAYCGVATGLSGNLLPGVIDVLSLSITQVGARLIEPGWTMNPLGNWYFSAGIAIMFTATAWAIIERVVAPRLGPWRNETASSVEAMPSLSEAERAGLRAAGLALLGVVAAAILLAVVPGYAPLGDPAAAGIDRFTPLFSAIPALMFLLFTATGWAYGAATGAIRSHRDVIVMMRKGLEPMLPYIVLVLFAAQFVAMFAWSNLGPITAIVGADMLKGFGVPPALLLPMLTTLTAWLDFLIASQSAKWTVMAPVAVPMFMLLEISPEMTTAAYRVGDTITNLISPMNAYFVLTLMFCQRWVPTMRLGSLLALTLPVAIALYIAGMSTVVLWVLLDIPVGPGAPLLFPLP
jgi:aminobenzoyl-glutamate transport protein